METRQHQQNHKPATRGFSLLELMIAIAIISVLAGIAIPLYDGYIREGHMATMRSTMNGLRTVAEDFHLDNGNYGATGSIVGVTNINGRFDWEPSGDSSPYTYTVVVTATNAYDVLGTLTANAAIWVRCENRFTKCCDPDSGTAVTSACP